MSQDLYATTTALLASQYNQPNILAIISSLCGSSDLPLTLQGTLSAIDSQPQTRFVGTAQGVQLDGIGDIVGLLRPEGISDDEYRQLLANQISTIRSSGTISQVYQVVAALCTPIGTGNTPRIDISEIFPQSMYITVYQPFSAIPSTITAAVQAACAAPVGVSLVGTNGEGNPFRLAGATIDSILTLNGEPLLVNSTYLITVTSLEDVKDPLQGFGVAPLASICG